MQIFLSTTRTGFVMLSLWFNQAIYFDCATLLETEKTSNSESCKWKHLDHPVKYYICYHDEEPENEENR